MTLANRKRAVAVAAAIALGLSLGVVAQRPGDGAAQAAAHEGHHAQHQASKGKNAGKALRTRKAVAFRADMRKLWEDHIVWTRQFIVSAIAELPDADTAAGRLLANQDDIGDAVKPFYGDEAGEQLSALLRDHILIAADILTAAKSGDSDGVAEANERWRANADDIAAFLASANPKRWPEGEMQSMMYDHLDLTLAEATARLGEDWDADVAAYDEIHVQILHMADMLATGIIKQFPNRF